MLGGVAGVAHSITGHEQTQLTESVIFISLVPPKDLSIQNFLSADLKQYLQELRTASYLNDSFDCFWCCDPLKIAGFENCQQDISNSLEARDGFHPFKNYRPLNISA